MRFSCSNRLFASLLCCVALCQQAVAASKSASKPTAAIHGLDSELKENVQLWLDNLLDDCNLSPLRERVVLRRAHNYTEQALQALGYYQADIKLQIIHSESCWQLRLDIVPNAAVSIGTLDIQILGEASNDPRFQPLYSPETLSEGKILQHQHYDTVRNHLQDLAKERGYFDAKLSRRELLIDREKLSAAIHLHLESGERYQFGDIHFEQTVLNEKFLQQFVRFKAGDDFDNQKLLALRQSLAGSGYFNDVRVEPLLKQTSNRQVPIRITSKPAPRYIYTAGVGFATDTGPRLRLGVENRRVNRRGHRYNTGLEVSPIRSNIGFNYEIPIADPKRERINLGASATHEDIDGKLSDRYRLRAAYLREWHSGWIATHFLDWENERYKIASQRDTTYLLMPGYELTRIKGNDPLYPTLGWKLTGMSRFAHQDLLSSTSLIQFHGLAKAVFPTWYGRILTRFEGGVTVANKVTKLPHSVRFFAGGDSSIRGYAYQSLGPEDADGRVIGGRHLMAASVEYEWPFSQKWYGAVFTDAGNAYDKLADFKAVYGSGLGLRWRSPIGPIRLDLAHPSQGSSRFRIHISMGLDL